MSGSHEQRVALPAVVTFATYLDDGRLQLQMRGFIAPDGSPVVDPGQLSINGGHMEDSNMATELAREIEEELGVCLLPGGLEGAVNYIGSTYDHTNGRTNYIFRLVRGYETMLKNMKSRDVARVLLNPEGIGRAAVWADDLQTLISSDRLTKISCQILQQYPTIWPPSRPIQRDVSGHSP